MTLPSKAAWISNIFLKDRNEIAFNDTKNCSISKSFFSNLAQNFVSKLESKVASYYDDIKHKGVNFENILKGLNPSKAAGIVNLSRKFLKDGADILAGSILQLCNLSTKLNSRPRSCKIAKAKPFFKKRLQNWPSKPPPHFTTPDTIKNCWKDYSWPNTRTFE